MPVIRASFSSDVPTPDPMARPAYCRSKTVSPKNSRRLLPTRSPWSRVILLEGAVLCEGGSSHYELEVSLQLPPSLIHTTLTLPGGVAEKGHVGMACVPTVCRVFLRHQCINNGTFVYCIWPKYFFFDMTSIRVGVGKLHFRVARSCLRSGPSPGSRRIFREVLEWSAPMIVTSITKDVDVPDYLCVAISLKTPFPSTLSLS